MSVVPEPEIQYRFVRSGGPGGQHVNKTSSKVQLRWNVRTSSIDDAIKSRVFKLYFNRINDEGELMLECDETRSQKENKDIVTRRLNELVRRAAKPPKRRRPTKPSKSALAKRRKTREQHSAKKAARKKPHLPED
jgi:ribosome-associated protein